MDRGQINRLQIDRIGQLIYIKIKMIQRIKIEKIVGIYVNKNRKERIDNYLDMIEADYMMFRILHFPNIVLYFLL